MSKYYKSNGLYDYLDSNPNPSLKFPKGELWALIYADKEDNFEPRVLALVIGVNETGKIVNNAVETRKLLRQISTRTGLPLVTIVFRTDLPTIEEVDYSVGDNKLMKISLKQLADELKDLGLPLNDLPTSHAINKASSSAYQNWQRENLGNKIVAVDIDMFKVSDQGDLVRFYELKRSFQSFEDWKPYVDDYNNFRALSKLANQTGVEFDIVYNIRTNNPWNDNVQELNVFNVDFSKQTPISEGRRISLSDFMEY
ncbi:hypothetical protein AAEO50_07355 [Rossellomorea oryzaecorticis]|uniref:Uncharacterized protein n=1 Tax=Rossellomorea oryzaecorticis TaxID=1396505 RepID=A0ABU9K7M9_9BACI